MRGVSATMPFDAFVMAEGLLTQTASSIHKRMKTRIYGNDAGQFVHGYRPTQHSCLCRVCVRQTTGWPQKSKPLSRIIIKSY